jgi:hypothetical protein
MNRTEAGVLLSVAAAFDSRTIGEADAMAWSAALADTSFDDARDAVIAHYADFTDRVMPAHIKTRVRVARRERVTIAPGTGAVAYETEIPDADPDDIAGYLAALRAGRKRRADACARRSLDRAMLAGVFQHVPAGEPR